MEDTNHKKNEIDKAWWQWLVFGPFTPFFRAHGFRELSTRETVGLVVVSIAAIVLGTLGMLGVLYKW